MLDALSITLLLTALMVLMEIFQILFIPWQTRRLVARHVDRLGPEALAVIARYVGPRIMKLIIKRINLDEVAGGLKKMIAQSIGGEMGQSRKKMKRMKILMYKDMMKNDEVGKFLMLFPQVQKHLDKHPDDIEPFVLEWLPRLNAMRQRSIQMRKIQAEAAARQQAAAQPSPLNTLVSNILPGVSNGPPGQH